MQQNWLSRENEGCEKKISNSQNWQFQEASRKLNWDFVNFQAMLVSNWRKENIEGHDFQ